MKPILRIKDEQRSDAVFYREFYKYYKLLKKDNDNFGYLVLSALFLHLTLESYITWLIRELLLHINRRKNRRVEKTWRNHYETSAYLQKKLQFFTYIFLGEENNPEVKKIEKLGEGLGKLRNKIVHGHEFAIWRGSDGTIDKTKLAKLLTFKKIDDYHDKFKGCIKSIPALIKKIDIEELTPGLSEERIVEHLAFKSLPNRL